MIFVIRRSHGWGIHEHFCRQHRRKIGPAGRGQGRGAAPRGPSRRADRQWGQGPQAPWASHRGETAPVAVSFVGTTVPHLEPFKGGLVGGSGLAEAKAQLNKKNDPGLFESSKWAKATLEAFTGWL